MAQIGILAVVQIAGAVIGAVSAIRQGNAAKAASEFNARVAEQNAGIVREQAAFNAKQSERETFLRLGAIRASAGHAGGAAGEGNVLDIIGDGAAQGELEKQNIIYQGELQARGYANTALLDRSQGDAAQQGSYYKAGSELLSGGAKAYDAYSRLNRA